MRIVSSIIQAKPTLEGAGVRLMRVFGSDEVPRFDPFLLFDHFGSDNPVDYIKGFPWHPHRGIETITYMLQGEVEHCDSIKNRGVIRSGDIQWMTAGSGIIHQEMPKPFSGTMMGFQLWVNLPRAKKMAEPRYRGITSGEMTPIKTENGTVNVIAGTLNGTQGVVQDLFVDVEYFDLHLNGKFERRTDKKTAFVYVYEGVLDIAGKHVSQGQCALLERKGDIIMGGNASCILVAGDPLKEPVAWGGPIVMNTQDELRQAFKELEDGTFIKDAIPPHVSKDFYSE